MSTSTSSSSSISEADSTTTGFSSEDNGNKRLINWKFLVPYINKDREADLFIPKRWLGHDLITTVIYQVEVFRDEGDTFYYLRGIMRLKRRTSESRLRSVLGLDQDDDIQFKPYIGVLDTAKFRDYLKLEDQVPGLFFQFGVRFVPRQGKRTDLERKYKPYQPPDYSCNNRCNCCLKRVALEMQLEELRAKVKDNK